MATHSVTQLGNGHSLTVLEVGGLDYRVDERNEAGTFLRFAYSTRSLLDATRWVARQVELFAELDAEREAGRAYGPAAEAALLELDRRRAGFAA